MPKHAPSARLIACSPSGCPRNRPGLHAAHTEKFLSLAQCPDMDHTSGTIRKSLRAMPGTTQKQHTRHDMNNARATATDIILRHIVPSFFCGYLLLAFFSLNYGEAVRRIQQEGHMPTVVLVMLLCGLGTGGINTFYHLVLRAKVVGRVTGPRSRANRLRHAGIGATVGLVCGSSTIVTALSNWGLLISTVFLVLLTIGHLKRFARSVVTMLKPGRYCMWPEILGLVEIYITIIACFTLINATLEIAHRGGLLANPQFPFSFETGVFADAVYFTVVTMTTLGFGDITPISPGAKLLTTLECLVGYVMFALTVGIITRGVVGSDDENL